MNVRCGHMLPTEPCQAPEMNIEEAASFLKMPPAIVMREIASRRLLCWHVNQQPRIRMEDLERYLALNAVTPRPLHNSHH